MPCGFGGATKEFFVLPVIITIVAAVLIKISFIVKTLRTGIHGLLLLSKSDELKESDYNDFGSGSRCSTSSLLRSSRIRFRHLTCSIAFTSLLIVTTLLGLVTVFAFPNTKIEFGSFQHSTADVMAQIGEDSREGGLPLNQFSKSCPPGWRPGLVKYPLRLYIQLVRLWWRQAECNEQQCGPIMAGRLRGSALQLVLALRADRLDLDQGIRREMVGDELLAQPSHPDWTAPDGQVHPAEAAGATLLINALTQEFQAEIQDQSISALEAFFDFERSNLSLTDYLTLWRLNFDEATSLAGLQMNNVAKSFLLLRKAGISPKERREYLLQIGGNLDRYEDLCAIMNRFSKATDVHHSTQGELAKIYGVGATAHDDDDWEILEWSEGYPIDDGWHDDWNSSYGGEASWSSHADHASEGSWGSSAPVESGALPSGPATSSTDSPDAFWGKSSSRKGRGKSPKGKGDGCVICGSPYHWKNECPMQYKTQDDGAHEDHWCDEGYEDHDDGTHDAYWYRGKGKGSSGKRSKGKRKGKKGFTAKGKGKSYRRPFGKGKGKHKGGYFMSQDWEYEDDSWDYGVFGTQTSIFPASTEPRPLAPPPPAASPSPSPLVFSRPTPGEDPLSRLRALTAQENTEATGVLHYDIAEPTDFSPVVPNSTPPRNVTGFNTSTINRNIFMLTAAISSAVSGAADAATYANSPTVYDMMFTVKGRHVHGLIVDGGAATALSGTETVRHYFEEILQPQGHILKIEKSRSTFTGVDGLPQPGLGLCEVPLNVAAPVKITWKTDLFGGQGSRCPMLLANDSLNEYRASILNNILPNQQGVLILWVQGVGGPGGALFLRLLVTDSGHTILPLSGHEGLDYAAEDRYLRKQVQKYMDLLLGRATAKPSRLALQESVTSVGDATHFGVSHSASNAPGTGSGLRSLSNHDSLDKARHASEGNKLPCAGRPHACPAVPAEVVEEVGSSESHSMLLGKVNSSVWTEPSDDGSSSRIWSFSADVWKTLRETSWFKTWKSIPGQRYTVDTWPKSFTLEDTAYYVKKYTRIAEEFYTQSELTVITPENVTYWFQLMPSMSQLQEYMSGSGRLSLCGLLYGLRVSFPVDFRYGWDTRVQKNRELLDVWHNAVNYYAPQCGPWCAISRLFPAATQALQRKLEIPVLSWISRRALLGLAGGEATICESSQQSCIFDKSPLSEIAKHDKASRKILDQCQHGAYNLKQGLPVRKPTALVFIGIKLVTPFRRCQGASRCAQHADLLGNEAGGHAVYPWQLCEDIIADCNDHLSPGSSSTWFNSVQEPADVNLMYSIDVHWSCKRCKYGKKSSEPHTYKPGCKYNKGLKVKVPIDAETKASPKAPQVSAKVPPASPSPPSVPAPPASLPSGAAASDPPIVERSSSSSQPASYEPASTSDAEVPAVKIISNPQVPVTPDSLPPSPKEEIKVTVPKEKIEEPGVLDQPVYIEPSFDLKTLHKRLLDPNVSSEEKLAGLLGLHIKFWHLPAPEMVRMLRRVGHGKDIIDMIPKVIDSCEECQKWTRTLTKPLHSGQLAEFFNHRVHTDLFFLFEKIFIILIDECIRYCVAAELRDKTAVCWLETVFLVWIRYFGPMLILASDQESAITSDLCGLCCEKFDIERSLGGSHGHTAAPIAERRLALIKLSALKLKGTCKKNGIQTDDATCVFESAMVSNLMLTYGGMTPAQALTGTQPREFYDPDNKSLAAVSGALESTPDYIERSIRLRFHAKDCILQSIWEDRWARAENTKVQQLHPQDVSKLVDGAKIDIWREPDQKGEPSWRGPAELLRLFRAENKVIVYWRGVPMMLPLRFIRLHVGFVWLLDCASYSIYGDGEPSDSDRVTELLKGIDQSPLGIIVTYGLLWNESHGEFKYSPEDLLSLPPRLWVLAKHVSIRFLHLPAFDGIQYGTQSRRTKPIEQTFGGRLLVWSRHDHSNYRVTTVTPNVAIPLDSGVINWHEQSFLLFFWYNKFESQEEKTMKILEPSVGSEDMSLDLTPVPFEDSPWSSFGGSWLQPTLPDISMPSASQEVPKPPPSAAAPPPPPGQGPQVQQPEPKTPPRAVKPKSAPPPMPWPAGYWPQPPTGPAINEPGLANSSAGPPPPPAPPAPPAVPIAAPQVAPVPVPAPQPVEPRQLDYPIDPGDVSVQDREASDELMPNPDVSLDVSASIGDTSPAKDASRSRSRIGPIPAKPPMCAPPSPVVPSTPPAPSRTSPPISPQQEELLQPGEEGSGDRSSTREYPAEPAGGADRSRTREYGECPLGLPVTPPKSLSPPTAGAASSQPLLPTHEEAAALAPEEVLPVPENEQDEDGDCKGKSELFHNISVWYADALKQSSQTSKPVDLDFDPLAHAVASAELCLHAARLECEGTLPWSSEEALFTISGNFRNSKCVYYSWSEDGCFSVSSDDILTSEEVYEFWDLVEAGDKKEIASFAQHGVFALDAKHGVYAKADRNIVDGIWVRRWINRKSRLLKCRLCSRGFLDKQKTTIDKHSSTASRLSHRLALSMAVQWMLCVEAWDISTAFLQGLRFREAAVRARALGFEARCNRQVWLAPPPNVWRHLKQLNSPLGIEEYEAPYFLLKLVKAMYGLTDGPLMFQLALLEFMVNTIGLQRSVFDDNFLYQIEDGADNNHLNARQLSLARSTPNVCTSVVRPSEAVRLSAASVLLCVIIIHVDDLLVCALPGFMDMCWNALVQRFGSMKRQRMPLVYIGMRHSWIAENHMLVDQEAYLDKLEMVPISRTRARQETQPLEATEHFAFRSLVCSLLWLTLTRIDIVADVVLLQQEMEAPLILHLKQANSVLKKARSNKTLNGLHFHRLQWPLKITGISDAGSGTKRSVYAQEGRMVLLMSDRPRVAQWDEWMPADAARELGGYGHPLHTTGKKSTRVSHSSSHSESVAATTTTQVAQLIAMRITEPFARIFLKHLPASTLRKEFTGRRLLPSHIAELQRRNLLLLPVDHITDCMDLFELCCGGKGLTADKSQRVIILSLREDRLTGRIRTFIHVPTQAMLADGLTKAGVFFQLLRFATTGLFAVVIAADKMIRLRTRSRITEFTANDLEHLDS